MAELHRDRTQALVPGGALLGILLLAAELCPAAQSSMLLENDKLRLDLTAPQDRTPYIAGCRWQPDSELVFAQVGGPPALTDWLPQTLCSARPKSPEQARGWERQDDDVFLRAKARYQLNDLEVTWVVELAKDSPLIQLYVQLKNTGPKDICVDWYPIWAARWSLAGAEPRIKYWEALTYQPHVERLSAESTVRLHSHVYSSDRKGEPPGKVPYWQIKDTMQVLYFAIAWCGGWQADIEGQADGISLSARLPSAETQLVLQPQEQIAGPILSMMPFRGTDEVRARAAWIEGRERLARRIYGGPRAEYPLVYNHWYSVGRNLSREFLAHQVEALVSYGFDVFVLDDGWFEEVGDWKPAKDKFEAGELESVFALIHSKKMKTGIWSCPWLMHADADNLPPEVDRPPFLRKYMQAYALDLAGTDFTRTLLDHIGSLKDQFGIDWWKYDQELFGQKSRHGRMKNIIALQKALRAVRHEYPELVIESCMSGGRMINAFTDAISQIHWIRDGGRTGYEHARTNITEALGAVDFMSPSMAQRWTNRPNEVKVAGGLLRYYCRSAMVGVWGVSADLYKITPEQERVIADEVKNYRRLNQYKAASLYEILYPADREDVTGVIYYTGEADAAAVLLFRLQGEMALAKNVKLRHLKPNLRYRVTSTEKSEGQTTYTGTKLTEEGLPARFSSGQLSALYFARKQ